MDRKRSCFSCWIPRNGLSCDLRWPMDVLLVCANQKENTIKYRNFLHGTAAVAKWGQEGVWTSRPIAFMVPIHSLNRPILSTPRSRRRALFRSVGKTHPAKARLPKVGPKGLESWSLVQPSTAWDQLRRSQQPNASTFPVACGGLRLADSPHIVAHWQRTISDCWMRTHVSRRYNSFRWKSTFQWTTAARLSNVLGFPGFQKIWHIDTYFTIVHDHCSFAVSLSLWWLYLLLYILNSLLAPLKPCSISTWPVCNDLWSWPVPCFNQRGKSFSALAITSNATWAAIQSPVSTDKKRIVWICRNGPVKNPDWCQRLILTSPMCPISIVSRHFLTISVLVAVSCFNLTRRAAPHQERLSVWTSFCGTFQYSSIPLGMKGRHFIASPHVWL